MPCLQSRVRLIPGVLMGCSLALVGQVIGWSQELETGDVATSDESISFNQDIRPILSENCFYCHGQDANQRQADLRLDQRQPAIEAGALTPGNAEDSSLVFRIQSDDESLRMPPVDSNRVLSDRQKALLATWIQQGAEYETHWAFQDPVRPSLPSVDDQDWCQNPIDQFILARLEAHRLSPAPQADRRTLIKRLHIDLTGLPPTPEAVQAFVDDPDPDAYSQLVEQLLASPHYGERMALPWLDAARYADSNGFQQDGDHWQWIWRDQLVQLLNRDQPFDQFTIWQLAGDLLPDATQQQKIASGFNRNHMLNGEGGAIAEEQRWVNLFDRVDTTATTWLGLTMACGQCHDHKYDPITQAEYYQFLDAFNRVPERGVPRYFSARIRIDDPFLELPTQENKERLAQYDQQIAQQQELVDRALNDAFAGWLAEVPTSGPAIEDHSYYAEAESGIRDVLAVDEAKRSKEQNEQLQSYLRKVFDKQVVPDLTDLTGMAERKRIQDQRQQYHADQIPRVMIMSDGQARKTHRLDRGQYLSPLEEVSFGTPAFLPPLGDDQPRDRLGLARWLVSDHHPLTARVQVNRMWQHFFGQGLVKTAEDFGVQSQYPVHRELLDWLAVEFRESGWKVKDLHRLILTSATYRQESRVSTAAAQRDPENRLLSRGARFRMPAMVLRDWALASSGLLNREIGGPPVYPYQPDNVWESLAITKERDFTYPLSNGPDLYRRSLYTFWRRTVGPANMFDTSNRQTCRVRAPQTSTPLHALTTLNDRTWVEAARHLASVVMENARELPDAESAVEAISTAVSVHAKPQGADPVAFDPTKAIDHAFVRVLCRPAAESEKQRMTESFRRWQARYQQEPELAKKLLAIGESERDDRWELADHAAMTVTCLTILNLDEALTRE